MYRFHCKRKHKHMWTDHRKAEIHEERVVLTLFSYSSGCMVGKPTAPAMA